MELREISMYEAGMNDLPAGDPGPGMISSWYALDDEEDHKGFMEVLKDEEEDISVISYFMIPDIYREKGYGPLMLKKFLDMYIPGTTPDSVLSAFFEYSSAYGRELSQLFSDHGFEIRYNTYRECVLAFDRVYEKLSSKTASSYKGTMMNLAEGMSLVLSEIDKMEEPPVSYKDLHGADHELSVAAFSEDGKLEALLLASEKLDRKEVSVTDLYVASDDILLIRRIFAFAVENAGKSNEVPAYISFIAADEKLERVMNSFFGNPPTSNVTVAEAEFDLERYLEQLKVADELRR